MGHIDHVVLLDYDERGEAGRIDFLQRLVSADNLDVAVDKWLNSIFACGRRAVRIQRRLIMDCDLSPNRRRARRYSSLCGKLPQR